MKKIIRRVTNVFQTSTYKTDKHYITFRDKDYEFVVNAKKGVVECKDEALQQRVTLLLGNLLSKRN